MLDVSLFKKTVEIQYIDRNLYYPFYMLTVDMKLRNFDFGVIS